LTGAPAFTPVTPDESKADDRGGCQSGAGGIVMAGKWNDPLALTYTMVRARLSRAALNSLESGQAGP
jgi:hypothetical protein